MGAWIVFNLIILSVAFLIGFLSPQSVYSHVPYSERFITGAIWVWIAGRWSFWIWVIYAIFHFVTKYW